MPNAKVLSEKQAIVEALTQRISNAASGVLVDYKGINVAEDTALRRELRAAGIEYTVVKNTLLRFAVDKCNFNEFDSLLNGTTSLATTEGDPIAPIRIVSENAKKLNGKFEIKGGFMEGKVLSLDELNEIAYRNDESIRSYVERIVPTYHPTYNSQKVIPDPVLIEDEKRAAATEKEAAMAT